MAFPSVHHHPFPCYRHTPPNENEAQATRGGQLTVRSPKGSSLRDRSGEEPKIQR
jgi:hypothetical protein